MIPINASSIEQATARIAPYIHKTPLLTSNLLNERAQCELVFKCENLQKIGAFKMRGASNAALKLGPPEQQKGLCTHSSGNHAQAVAKIAQTLGIPAHIVMPKTAPQVKVDAVRTYGASIYFCEPTLQAREEKLKEVQDSTGATFIHPFNNWDVIEGQATCAFELIHQCKITLDAIVTPVGGGGLLAGTLLSKHYFSPTTQVFAAEPEGAQDAYLSMKAGKIVPAPEINTIADGLLTTIGEKNFEVMQQELNQVLLVTDEELIEAMKLIYQYLKIVIEPSCAAPLAAILKNEALFKGKKVGIVLSGGNIDLQVLASLF